MKSDYTIVLLNLRHCKVLQKRAIGVVRVADKNIDHQKG